MPMLLLGILIGAIVVAGSVFGLRLHPPGADDVQMSYADSRGFDARCGCRPGDVLGVFIAVLALWGYAQFKSTTRSAAIGHVKEELEDGGKLRILLRSGLTNPSFGRRSAQRKAGVQTALGIAPTRNIRIRRATYGQQEMEPLRRSRAR